VFVPTITTAPPETIIPPAVSTSLAPSTYIAPPAQSTNSPAQSTYTLPTAPIETQRQFSGQVLATAHRSSSFASSAISALSALSSPTQSPNSPWNGIGPLLTGTCATPEFSLVYGPQTATMYYIGIIGCEGGKPDCCPFPVATPGATTDATTTKTVGRLTITDTITTHETISGLTVTKTITAVTAGGSNPTVTAPVGGPSGSNRFIFPAAASPSQVTLSRCPEDYVTVSSVCCPS
jgi:hypothetical protein